MSCGIHFNGGVGYPIDDNGCIKKMGHNDAHVFIDKEGNTIEWQDDYKCKCGCWDDEDNLLDVCKIYTVHKRNQN